MSQECTHDCNTCKEKCNERDKTSMLVSLPENVKVKKIIAISSGKGGVGKSLVTSLLASGIKKRGFNVAILDADITGPSIPKSFGIYDNKIAANENNLMIPKKSRDGIQIISANLLLDNETDPIVWRGSLISQAVKQFWSETYWEDVDFMFVDMPPGTGDVPLSVYQFMPVDAVIIVTSPQQLVSMIVEKSINMARKMDKKVLGIIENMSYVKCPNCSEKIKIFGESKVDEIAIENKTEVLAKVAMDMKITKMVDSGRVDELILPEIDKALDKIQSLI
ncbi:MAG: Mrp/NBP35 family ATP-binding protein [Eubacteriales bacterium]|nr:Mrp/NBP35 family ATP-binding protein [Eubacteriales bacterium]